MRSKVYIHINSLSLSVIEFETIVWNQTNLDEIKTRKYVTDDLYNEDFPIQMIRYLNSYMDPIFVIDRWIADMYNRKKTYDNAMFWLRVFLNKEVSAILPPLESNPEFISNIRRSSSALYSKIIKNSQNF